MTGDGNGRWSREKIERATIALIGSLLMGLIGIVTWWATMVHSSAADAKNSADQTASEVKHLSLEVERYRVVAEAVIEVRVQQRNAETRLTRIEKKLDEALAK